MDRLDQRRDIFDQLFSGTHNSAVKLLADYAEGSIASEPAARAAAGGRAEPLRGQV